MRLRFLVPVLGLSSLVAVACSEGEVGGGAGGGDAGEETMGGDGPGPGPDPSGGSGGNAGEDTGAGGGCAEDGTGTLKVEVTGLPDGVSPEILIEGPGPALAPSGSEELEDVDAGQFTVTIARAFDDDPIVRTVFEPSITSTEFCLPDGGTQTIEVEYVAIPSSNKLWMPTDQEDELAGFSSTAIAEEGITDASALINTPAGTAITFDRDGNMWAFGATVAEPHVMRFPAASLGESGDVEADISIDLPEVACVPAMRSLAFDMAGNLWLSVCGDEIHRIPAEELTASGDKTSDVMLNGVTDNDGIAFDVDGNLWVAGDTALVRFDASRLGEIDSDPPDLALSVSRAGMAAQPLQASYLAFDAAGNAWGVDFGGNTIFQVAASDLLGTGEVDVEAAVSFVVGVSALPNAPAFDDGGGLWIGLSNTTEGGTFGRFSPEQLTMSAGTGDPITPEVLITSTSVGTDLPVAFFPAAEGLPLFHALPTP
jgi:sugar lactone lactonase YvrE